MVWGFLAVGLGIPVFVLGQSDTARLTWLERRLGRVERMLEQDSLRVEQAERSTFYLYNYLQQADSNKPDLKFGAYADLYAAWYSDSTGTDFQKFPTSAPRNQQIGLNMLYLSGQYSGKGVRGLVGIQFGDIPLSSWDPKLNVIQEANMGIRLRKSLWLDGGFFRTHIGMESIQPRENVTQSLAVTTYFEPYFLSGLKLSWAPTERLTLQAQVFNGFNNYIENNRNKAMGASLIYVISDKAAFTFNAIYCDESPDTLRINRHRLYNDAYFIYRGDNWTLAAEANLGIQGHSTLTDSAESAIMYSGILLAQRHFGRASVYARGEIFEDSNEILTGPVENEHHELVGINLLGGTFGIEYKPLRNTFFRLESRYLHTTETESIFYREGQYYHYRVEVLGAMGVWL